MYWVYCRTSWGRFSYAKTTRNQHEKREKIKIAKTRRKTRKNDTRSEPQIPFVQRFPRICTRNPFSRFSPSFRDIYLFAFFVLISCSFRVGKSLLRDPIINPVNTPLHTQEKKRSELIIPRQSPHPVQTPSASPAGRWCHGVPALPWDRTWSTGICRSF